MSKTDDMVYAYKTSPALRQEIDKAMQVAGEHIELIPSKETPNAICWFRNGRLMQVFRSPFSLKRR